MTAAAEPVDRIRKMMTSKSLFSGYLLKTVPLAAIAGLKITELSPHRCAASVPYGWRTQNPFRSTYFAALSMAAEMSTGAMAMLAVRAAPASVAMLIVGMEATFEKKADDLTTFVCEDGEGLTAAVAEAVQTGQPVTFKAKTVGTLPNGTVVARFTFTWSFKKRSNS